MVAHLAAEQAVALAVLVALIAATSTSRTFKMRLPTAALTLAMYLATSLAEVALAHAAAAISQLILRSHLKNLSLALRVGSS
jgi:hypothetical protein